MSNPTNVLEVVDMFLHINPRMPLRSLQAFLQVAAHPGLNVSEHAEISGLSMSTMSRNLLDLSDSHRSYDSGYRLIETRGDEGDQRGKRYYLTKRGRKMVDDAMEKIERENSNANT